LERNLDEDDDGVDVGLFGIRGVDTWFASLNKMKMTMESRQGAYHVMFLRQI
ncbi:hypothetical protein PanWU01x14_369090, partial [Parasponia andersonii]